MRSKEAAKAKDERREEEIALHTHWEVVISWGKRG